jgi:hypothetical protein
MKAFLVTLSIFIVTIFSLEILSKNYKCKISIPSPRCSVLREENFGEENKLLSDLRNKRLTRQKISKEEYLEAADKFILEVDPELMGGSNGIACGNIGYVRNNLPKEAKKYVKRHELEHLLQTGKERNPEFSANFAAAKEYPFGAIETVIFTLKNRAKYYQSPVCYLLMLWKNFKTYFLPFKEGSHSGRVRGAGDAVGRNPFVGSNPTPSANQKKRLLAHSLLGLASQF